MSDEQRDAEREVRAARNESLFRSLNERLERVRVNELSEAGEYFCECARRDCAALVRLSGDEYAAVRANGDTFLVVPGHTTSRIERILEQHHDYWIVEKIGVAGHVAEVLNPRAN